MPMNQNSEMIEAEESVYSWAWLHTASIFFKNSAPKEILYA